MHQFLVISVKNPNGKSRLLHSGDEWLCRIDQLVYKILILKNGMDVLVMYVRYESCFDIPSMTVIQTDMVASLHMAQVVFL